MTNQVKRRVGGLFSSAVVAYLSEKHPQPDGRAEGYIVGNELIRGVEASPYIEHGGSSIPIVGRRQVDVAIKPESRWALALSPYMHPVVRFSYDIARDDESRLVKVRFHERRSFRDDLIRDGELEEILKKTGRHRDIFVTFV